MKLISKISNVLLLLVGCLYVLMGIMSLVELPFGFLISTVLVVPLQLLFATYDWNAGIINQQLFYSLVSLAIFGGSIAIFGANAISKGKIFGYKIWIGLSVLALATSLWNIVWLLGLPSPYFPLNSVIAAAIFSIATYASWYFRDSQTQIL